MGKSKRILSVVMAALMLVFTFATNVTASAAVVLPKVQFVGLQNIPAAVGEEQTLMLTSNYDGNVQYQVFYVQRNNPNEKIDRTWTKLGDWTTAADAKTPVEVKVPAGTITVAGNYSFAVRVKRAGTTGTYSNTYGDYDNAYPFNYAFAATATAGLKDAKVASAEVSVGENFVISGLTAGNSYRLFTLNEARANRWDSSAVATSTTDTLKWAPTAVGNYVLDLQLVDANGKVTAVKLFNVKVNDSFKVVSVKALNATQVEVKYNKAVDKTTATNVANYTIPNAATASLVDDYTVVITTSAPITGTNLYVVKDNVVQLKDNANVKAPIFTTVETYTDTVAPYVVKVEYPTYDKALVTFSEPISNEGALTVTGHKADGTTALALSDLNRSWSTDKTQLTLDLAAADDKDVSVVMVGACDTATLVNLISPNPTTITVRKTKLDTTAPSVADVKVLSDTKLEVKFSEKLSTTPVVSVTGATTTKYETDDSITFTVTTTSVTGIQKVTVAKDYADMSANKGAEFNVLKSFAADTTKPALVGSEVKVIDNAQYLVLTFSEDVRPNAAAVAVTGSRVDSYITYDAATTALATQVTDNKKAVKVLLTGWKTGAYSLTIAKDLVNDYAADPTGNGSAAVNVSFVLGSYTGTDTTAPTVTSFDESKFNAGYVTVSFDDDMDPASALNVANYKVGGLSIFTNAIFVENAKTVKLTVAPGKIAYTGSYAVSVTGVKDKAGNTVTAYSAVKALNENIAPYVTKAVLADASTVVVTLSENVTFGTGAFEVWVNGVQDTTVAVKSVGANTISLTIKTVDDLNKAIQVKLVGDVKDTYNNAAATSTTTVTLQ